MNMKRREFSQAAACTALAYSGLLLPLAHAQTKAQSQFSVGKDYHILDARAPVEAPAGKIEVVEFFWYNCPHCNAFEPTLAAWIKTLPKDVSFRRSHVAFQDAFVWQQRLALTLEAMGLVEKLHAKVFAAIHVGKVNMTTGEAISDWVSRQGVDKAKFLKQYNSFSIQTKASNATQLQDAYKVAGVPAFGIDGRFYTDGTMAGTIERALKVTDTLVADLRTRKA